MTTIQPANEPAPLTLMAVHAHPDDEVVFTGGALPLYSARGVHTVVVCCTGGEEGEIHDPDLDPEAAKPHLGTIRASELRCAAEALAVEALEWLGYRDSGMVGTEPNAHPASFHQAPRDEATARLVALVRRYRPQVLLTYNEFGAYGHPDHIAANQITHAAYALAGDPAYRPDLGAPWTPLKLYWAAWNEEGFKQAREMYHERGLKWPWDDEEASAEPATASEEEAVAETVEPAIEGTAPAAGAPAVPEGPPPAPEAPAAPAPPPYQPPPVTTRLDVRAVAPNRLAAFACHRTQFAHDGLFLTIPADIAEVAFGEEHYTLVLSRVDSPPPETDLFAGIPNME